MIYVSYREESPEDTIANTEHCLRQRGNIGRVLPQRHERRDYFEVERAVVSVRVYDPS